MPSCLPFVFDDGQGGEAAAGTLLLHVQTGSLHLDHSIALHAGNRGARPSRWQTMPRRLLEAPLLLIRWGRYGAALPVGELLAPPL
jgi:hypothetical protein